MTAAYGVDCSHYQGQISWAQVAAAGKRFAVLKATEGTGWTDPRFRLNWAEAKAVGIAVGAYHYFRPGLDPSGQARHFRKTVGALSAGDLIPWLDVEDERMSISGPPQPLSLVVSQLAECIDECQKLFGVRPGIYTGQWFWNRLAHGGRFAGYPLWVAYWYKDAQPSGNPPLPMGWNSFVVHQYTSKGQVAGIVGNVDLDWSPDLSGVTIGGEIDKTEQVVAAIQKARAELDQALILLGGD